MRHISRRLAVLAAIAMAAVLGAGGCHWLPPAGSHWPPTKDVPAEFALTSDRLVIVPYASTEMLSSDPTLTVEIGRDVFNEIMRNLGPKKIKMIVSPFELQRWQEANPGWQEMTLVDIGKALRADTVLSIELQQYTLTEEHSDSLYRGRVRARVYVVRPAADHNPVFKTIVETVFPENGPINATYTTEQGFRNYTNLLFAADVVNKFYDRQVEIKGGDK